MSERTGRSKKSGQPRSGQPRSSKPRSSKPRSDKPRSGKPRVDKPRSGKPRSGKQHSGRTHSDAPRSGGAPAGKHQPAGPTAVLAKDLSRVLRLGHPWVYRDAVRHFDATPGDVVTVRDPRGRFIGRGIAERGPIAVRVWTTKDEPVDESFVRRRIRDAVALRRRLTPANTDAMRLLHGEGDRLGGAVCDRYGDVGVLRLDGGGTTPWEACIADALMEEARLETLLVKRGRRGASEVSVLRGPAPPEGDVAVLEYGMKLPVDVFKGQKTGLFLDHRESRRMVRGVAEGMRVLNLYGYTGGFSIAAGLGGARHVTTVDSAREALRLASEGWANNGLSPSGHEAVCEDVARFMEGARAERRQWDLIISDPPSFAPKKDARSAALKAYRALHKSCLRALSDGGLFVAASCSSHIDRDAFEQTIRDAAEKANVVLTVLGRWGAAPDHPRLLAFPEGDYLTVSLFRGWTKS